MSILLVASLIVIIILFSIYYVSQRKFNYWEKKKVPYIKPTAFLGNYSDYLLTKKTYGEVAQEICNSFPKEPFVGAFFGTEPTLVVQDPEIIKLVTTKDFYYFNSREIMDHIDKEYPVGLNLFATYGDKWKVTRQHMTPIFTSAKMRNMFHLIEKCSHEFEDMLDREHRTSQVQEMRSLIARYTMDCICSCGFGVDTNTMEGEPMKNPFFKMGQEIFEVSNVRACANNGRALWPSIFFALGFQAMPKSVSVFFHELLTGVFKSRKYTPTSRNDFVDQILGWTKKSHLSTDSFTRDINGEPKKFELKVDDEYLVAQCVVFFAAGFETSATTLSFTLYELAKHPDLQKRALEEVDEYLRKNNNKLDYNCVTQLPFLEACVDEALRLYPVLNVITREVVEDYTLPTGLRLDRGVRIHLPVYHMHRNPEHFPEPEQYRPERFFPENRHNIKPYTYMPFGEGQRICIG